MEMKERREVALELSVAACQAHVPYLNLQWYRLILNEYLDVGVVLWFDAMLQYPFLASSESSKRTNGGPYKTATHYWITSHERS
jgi:hypothetical protein